MTGNPQIGKKNLIPMNLRTPEERILLQQRGGRAKSIAKTEAAKLRCIKERIAKDIIHPEQAAWLLQKLESRPSMAAELLVYIEKLKAEGVHPNQRIALGHLEQQAAKFIHGDKVHVESVNLNVNVSLEEWERRMIGEDDEELK